MKISYAITVCNEFLEIQKLVPFLLNNKRQQDEIVLLYDENNGNPEVLNYLLKFNKLPNVQTWRSLEFNGHFANWKNKLTSYCTGDYIFQIDADEVPHELLLENLPTIFENNPDNEVYLTPRVNTVSGLTQKHIQEWGWNVDGEGKINWPDYQWRIWKNKPEIKWKNKVHEVLEGHKTYSLLPALPEMALNHPKTIEKQVKQNNYYDTL